jgi:hypothetical protein
LLFIGILLASCGPSAAGQPTPDVQKTIEANAQLLVVSIFQTQTALAPTVTNTALPTVTLLPTSTALPLLQSSATVYVAQPVYLSPTPTGTYYTATPLASSLGAGCNNLRLVSSYTVPEGPFLPGQDFTQYWQVENNGTCDWMFVYSVEFASGDKLGEASSVKLSNKIPPGKWTTLSVGLHAPKKSGTFKSSWRFTDGGGTQFGAVLLVNITVGGPTSTPKSAAATPDELQTAQAINTNAAASATAACDALILSGAVPAAPCP